MKTKFALLFLSLSLAVLALAGCQAFPAPGAAAAPSATATAAPATSTPLPRPTIAPTAAATATPDPSAGATAAAQALAAALEKGDAAAAADLLSEFGLTYSGLTRGEASAKLSADPAVYALLTTTLLDGNTALVGVTVSPKDGSAPRGESWVFRQENERWLYNFDNLIGTLTLDVDALTTNGVTFQPRILVRYSDHIRLELLAQNQTNETVVFGQPNEILASFHFGDKVVEAETKRIVLEPKRSYPNVAIEVKGEFTSFPASIDIRTWKNYKVAPWFTFDLTR